MKHLMPALRILLFMSVITGVVYPLAVTFISQALFGNLVSGSIVQKDLKPIGSRLVGQKFESPSHFWSRPSAVDNNPLPTGGSNLGQISADLKKVVEERRANLKRAHPNQGEPPQDLLFASGSGIDPHISPEAARYQMARVAGARNFSDGQRARLAEVVKEKTEHRQFGIFGEPMVNVLELNLALEGM